jgi:hypothetical protein
MTTDKIEIYVHLLDSSVHDKYSYFWTVCMSGAYVLWWLPISGERFLLSQLLTMRLSWCLRTTERSSDGGPHLPCNHRDGIDYARAKAAPSGPPARTLAR